MDIRLLFPLGTLYLSHSYKSLSVFPFTVCVQWLLHSFSYMHISWISLGRLQDVMFNAGVCICVCVHERRKREREKKRKSKKEKEIWMCNFSIFSDQLSYITKYAASRINCLAGCRHTAGTVMTHRTSLPSSTEEDWSFTSWKTHTQTLLLFLLLSKLHSTDNIFIRLLVIDILISVPL